MSAIKKFSHEELHKEMIRALKGKLSTATVKIRFITTLIGGQPATDKGVEAYVKHHLKLVGQEAEDAVSRIMKEEIREDEEITPAEGEVKEEKTYGLNVLRRNAKDQAYIGTWQVRAMVKQAGSRLGLFQTRGKVGSKGDLSEGMLVSPIGRSKIGGVQEIGILVDGKPYAEHVYQKFMGSVSSPTGKKSIVHESETAPAGAEMEFQLQWPSARILAKDMAGIFGLAERCGLGSVRSMENGRFEVLELTVESEDPVEGDDGDESGKTKKIPTSEKSSAHKPGRAPVGAGAGNAANPKTASSAA